jgi:hypothetical protein
MWQYIGWFPTHDKQHNTSLVLLRVSVVVWQWGLDLTRKIDKKKAVLKTFQIQGFNFNIDCIFVYIFQDGLWNVPFSVSRPIGFFKKVTHTPIKKNLLTCHLLTPQCHTFIHNCGSCKGNYWVVVTYTLIRRLTDEYITIIFITFQCIWGLELLKTFMCNIFITI